MAALKTRLTPRDRFIALQELRKRRSVTHVAALLGCTEATIQVLVDEHNRSVPMVVIPPRAASAYTAAPSNADNGDDAIEPGNIDPDTNSTAGGTADDEDVLDGEALEDMLHGSGAPRQGYWSGAPGTNEQGAFVQNGRVIRPPTIRTFSQERRRDLADAGLERAEELLEVVTTPRDLHYWAQATNILVSLRRSEETDNAANFEVDDLRNNITRRLDDIKTRGGGLTPSGLPIGSMHKEPQAEMPTPTRRDAVNVNHRAQNQSTNNATQNQQQP